jgi:hypothetical protein
LFAFGGLAGGICSIGTPFEMLHLWHLGVLKLLLTAIFAIGVVHHKLEQWHIKRIKKKPGGGYEERPSLAQRKKGAVKFPSAEFERRIRYIQQFSARQSDRDMPRTPFRHGVTELTRLNGQEYPGLCLMTMICLKGIFVPFGKTAAESKKYLHLEKALCLLLFLALSLEMRITASEFTEGELDQLEYDIRLFLRFFRAKLGMYVESFTKSGLRRAKFHAPLHLVRLIRFLGATANFFGGYCESFQKTYVKRPCERTSKKHLFYLREIMQRFVEYQAIFADKVVQERHDQYVQASKAVPDDLDHVDASQALSALSARSYRSSCSSDRDYIPGGTRFSCRKGEDGRWSTWDLRGNCVAEGGYCYEFYPDKGPDDNPPKWVETLARQAEIEGYDRVDFLFHVDTPGRGKQAKNEKTHETFRCHPCYSGRKWHDWCIANFEDKHGVEYQTTAKILLWGMFGRQNETYVGTGAGKPPRPLYAACRTFARSGSARRDDILPCGSTDKLDPKIYAVNFDTIDTVAYVLPINYKREEEFLTEESMASAYFSVPQRTKWADLCWDNKLLNEFRDADDTRGC